QVFAWEGDNADVPRAGQVLPFGAFHDSEAVFNFPKVGTPYTANQLAYQDQVTAQWTGYARTGNPTAANAPLWYPFANDRGDRLVMSLQAAGDSAMTPASTISMQHNCGFWNAVAPPPR